MPISTPQEPLPYSAYIAGVLLDHARELGAAPRGSHDLATVLGWWVRSGLGEAAFVERLHAARAETRQRQAPGRDKWLLYLDALRAGLRE